MLLKKITGVVAKSRVQSVKLSLVGIVCSQLKNTVAVFSSAQARYQRRDQGGQKGEKFHNESQYFANVMVSNVRGSLPQSFVSIDQALSRADYLYKTPSMLAPYRNVSELGRVSASSDS